MAKRLKNYSDVRRYLANLINRTENGDIDPKIASKLGYLCGYLLKAIEGAEVNERILELEKKVNMLMERLSN